MSSKNSNSNSNSKSNSTRSNRQRSRANSKPNLIESMRRGNLDTARNLLQLHEEYEMIAEDTHEGNIEEPRVPSEYLNQINKDGTTALMMAAYVGNLEAVKLLLHQYEIDPNLTDKNGDTALMIATYNHHLDVVKELLNFRKTEIEVKNKRGKTALNMAEDMGYADIVAAIHTGVLSQAFTNAVCHERYEEAERYLANPNININLPEENGTAPIYCATQNNLPFLKKLLADPRIDVNKVSEDDDKYTALRLAVNLGKNDEVTALLNHRYIDVNYNGAWDSLTPLMSAVENRNRYIIRILLHHPRIEVNQTTGSGRSALWFAIEDGSEYELNLLLAHRDIDPNGDPSSVYPFPLLQAAEDDMFECAKALLNHPRIQVNQKSDHTGESALFKAIQQDHLEITYALLAHPDIDINQRIHNEPIVDFARGEEDDTIWTLVRAKLRGAPPITLALLTEDRDILRDAIANPRFDLNAVDNEGRTAVMVGLQRDLRGPTSIAVSPRFTNVNAADQNGDTALILAARNGSHRVIRALLAEEGINVNHMNNAGETITSIARNNEDFETLALLGIDPYNPDAAPVPPVPEIANNNLPSRNIPRGTANNITFNDIENGNIMTTWGRNLNLEHPRYYKRNTYRQLNPKIDPSTRAPIVNPTHYKAHLVGGRKTRRRLRGKN